MDQHGTDDWVVVAQFQSPDADLNADLAITVLQGSGIPVVRFPAVPMNTLAAACLPMIQPVLVRVPPDRAAEARGLLKGQEKPPEQVKADVDALWRTGMVRLLWVVGGVAVVFGVMYFVSHGCRG
jgi:hypothetical protein